MSRLFKRRDPGEARARADSASRGTDAPAHPPRGADAPGSRSRGTESEGAAGRSAQATSTPGTSTALRADFPYLDAGEVYLDAACQSLRPQPVLDAMTEYYTAFGACGERGRYAWGRRVDETVEAARASTLAALKASPRTHTCAFTLNTTMGLNLLLQQLPPRRYARIVTTHHEHNSVFLSTMTAARRLGIPRHLVERSRDGAVDLTTVDLTDALVVLSAMDNVTGTATRDLPAIAAEVHRRGGALFVDAAQAAPHAFSALRGLDADAICFSAHKLYGPSLGVVVATDAVLRSLDLTFVGGGQVDAVSADGFVPASALHTRLEPGLQAWAEIVGYGAALAWFLPRRAEIEHHENALGARLHAALAEMPHLRVFTPGTSATPHTPATPQDPGNHTPATPQGPGNHTPGNPTPTTPASATAPAPAATVAVIPERVDAHRLAVFLSQAGIMVRSGHFCAHHWLDEREHLPALVRFSLGAHTTEGDIDHTIAVMDRLMRGL